MTVDHRPPPPPSPSVVHAAATSSSTIISNPQLLITGALFVAIMSTLYSTISSSSSSSTFLLFLLVVALLALFLVVHMYKLPASPSPTFFTNILLGHRGAVRDDFPCIENSLSAMRYAAKHPAVDGVEFDIVMSKDNHLIVFHDTQKMSRVCKPLLVEVEGQQISVSATAATADGAGAVRPNIGTMTLEQIKQYEYKTGPATDRIPTLVEMLDECQQMNPRMKMMIEVKELHKSLLAAQQLSVLFEKYDLYERAVVGSFHPRVLYEMRKTNPRVVTLLLVKKCMFSHWIQRANDDDHDSPNVSDFGAILGAIVRQSWLLPVLDAVHYWSCLTWLPWFMGCGVLGFHGKLINDGDIHVPSFQKRGYAINVWVVNTPHEKRHLLDVGGVAITTDHMFDKNDC